MSKKTLAYVVYPGISLLEQVVNRTLLGGIMGRGLLHPHEEEIES